MDRLNPKAGFLPGLTSLFPHPKSKHQDSNTNTSTSQEKSKASTDLSLTDTFAGTQVANSAKSTSGDDSTSLPQSPNPTVLMYIALAFGFSLAVNAWVFFRISVKVTLGLCCIGAVPFSRGLFVFIAQMLGAMAASGVVAALFAGPLAVTTTLGGGTSKSQGLFIEMFLTAVLVFTIIMLAAEKHKATFVAPIGIGLALFVCELAGVYYTGGSLNPARSFGPCVANHSFPTEHWIYWLGPFLGALLAASFFWFIKSAEYETVNPGQDFDDLEAGVYNPERDINRPVVQASHDLERPLSQEGVGRSSSAQPAVVATQRHCLLPLPEAPNLYEIVAPSTSCLDADFGWHEPFRTMYNDPPQLNVGTMGLNFASRESLSFFISILVVSLVKDIYLEQVNHSTSCVSIQTDFPAPTLPVNMSSFGSQARLAELTAAASARERQAKRELEEQHRAPRSVPVSLGAFTRPSAIISRNKGSKCYKPLTLDDIGEQEPHDCFAGDGASSVSDTETSTTLPIPRSSSADVRRIRLTSRFGRAPARQEYPMAEPTPARMAFQMPSHPAQQYASTTYHHPSAHSAPPETQNNIFTNVMVPDDLSPSKQEEKFMELQNEYLRREERQRLGNFHIVPEDYQSSEHSYMPMSQLAANSQQQNTGRPSDVTDDHYFVPYYPESEDYASSTRCETVTDDQPVAHSGVKYFNEHQQPSNIVSDSPTMWAFNPNRADATKKMQKFMTDDRASSKAREEQNVIYSPTIDYAQEEGSRDLGYEVMPPPACSSTNMNTMPGTSLLENALKNPAPGLPFPLDIGPPNHQETSNDEIPEDVEWRQRMEILQADPDFMTLNPSRAKDRERTRETMARAAKSLTIKIPEYHIHTEENENRLEDSAKWFHLDNRGNQALRDGLEAKVIGKFAADLRDAARNRNYGVLPDNFTVGVDDGLVVNLALTHTSANFTTYLFPGHGDTIDQRRNFHKVKPVPDWATAQTVEEKGSYFGGGNVTLSTAGSRGFIHPPQRVARDPRFRPALAPTTGPAMGTPTPVTPHRPIGGGGVGFIGGPTGSRIRNAKPNPCLDGTWQPRVDTLFGGIGRRG
ncbi:putative aquaporin rerated protein [Phaeomoniella chlamydospora]|uniref:Putative aquaporin rerated protein n=1 Tax=Phaeomoniella chlamydospora TaxID=158046 RepID=A0A0G2ER71_PHACM|nr:putative aquaporin rerated protein [Phaeomoniella chlamydospora]